jgi:hypothetical protein
MVNGVRVLVKLPSISHRSTLSQVRSQKLKKKLFEWSTELFLPVYFNEPLLLLHCIKAATDGTNRPEVPVS